MWILVHLMLFQRSLKLSSFKYFSKKFLFYIFLFWLGDFHYPRLFPDYWFVLLYHLICYWFPVVYFSFQLLYSSALIGSFLYFLTLFWSSYCVPPLFSKFSEHLCEHYFEFFIRQLISFISLKCVSEVCLVLSLGTYFFISSFCLALCVCFYVLGKTATSLGL